MRRFFCFLILVSFLQSCRGRSDTVTEQREIASSLCLENNSSGPQSETVITAAITVDDEKFDDNELRRLFVRNFKLYENLVREKNKNATEEAMKVQRKSRDVVNETSHQGIECLSCFANGTSKSDEDCYQGVSVVSKKCENTELCYTELHPWYIKRGCVSPGRLNRTFVCKCPLCNDKPSFETRHYEYDRVSDWEYDYYRLEKPMMGIDIICKICKTKGSNRASDNICRVGKNADYMVCGHDQMCFTNIDNERGSVTRGCIAKPVYNLFHAFCNTTNCNNERFYNKKSKVKRSQDYKLNFDLPARRKMVSKCGYRKYTNCLLVSILTAAVFNF